MTKPQLTSYTVVKKKKERKIFLKNQEQDKDAHLCHFYLT